MPGLAFVVVPGGIVLIILTYVFCKQLRCLHKNIQEANGRLRGFLAERLLGVLVVCAFGKEEESEREVQGYIDEHRAACMRRIRFSNLCNIGFGGMIDAAYLVGIIWCGYGILAGTMSYGTFVGGVTAGRADPIPVCQYCRLICRATTQ